MRMKVSGFALGEAMLALMIVAVIGLHIVETSAIHVARHAQATAKLAATRLAAELSEWVRRQGLQALGVPASEMLAASALSAAPCHGGDCDAQQGAHHFLAQWRARLLRAVPDARAEVCLDRPPAQSALGWACDPNGSVSVLKLGWPPYRGATDFGPVLAVVLGRPD